MILHGREVEVHVYTLYKKIGNDNEWFWDDECMENPKNDKTFLKLLFDDFAKQLEVE